MQNLHRHSSYSNIFIADSSASNEDYAKRAKEIGHKALSSVEHGWQGHYFQVYELAKKYDLKTVIGAEAYWVRDRFEKDRSNHHICMWAKSNQGREAINDILSEANITGYYFRPRVDIPLLLSLPPKDVVISSACIAFSGYDDIDDIVLKLHEHFRENFFLEIQYHNTEKQKQWSEHQLSLASRYGIDFIVGLDSHYIYPEESKLRDYILEAKDVHYEDEEGWFMDYPDDDEIIRRFKEQNVFSDEQIKRAMDNTDISLEFCDYDNVRIFTKDIKLPSLYPDLTKLQKDKKYSKLISDKFREYMKNVPKEDYQRYFDGVKSEVQTYKDTGMCDYPLLDYAIVKDAVEHGGLITDTGRGSAVSYFTNTLCGFSKIDRFKSAIKLYPERFISTTRILQTKSLPDIDLNVGTPEIFEEAQQRVLGENHAVAMIAFGTLKKKSAFKLYARAKGMDFDLANTISEQIDKYEEAVKNAEDGADDIDIFDFIDKQYREYIEQSRQYWGTIMDKKKAPSAYLLYDGDIRREIGLIKCKSETTKKEYITCVIDGMIAENYKFLKNDILKVDVVLLIDKVFKRIGCEHFDVNTLIEKTKDDPKVWDIYANGYTIGINQVEQDGSRRKCMNYKPHNISELSAFVAAIRPGFKSMYSRFENREDFSWGIPVLDNMLRTEELPVSYVFFQEQVMSILNYAGFPMDECYGIIKAIAKKHPEKVLPLKEKFIVGFRQRLIDDEKLKEDKAQEYADRTWTIINDNCGYSFNSSHAYSVALDSLYQAWQKAHHPYEFYEVLLQHYTSKGNKNKVSALKNEMRVAFGITEGRYQFGKDNRHFLADPKNHCINPDLSAIKGMSSKAAEELYNLSQHLAYKNDFLWLLKEIKTKTSIGSKTLDTLIKLDYFSDFGHPNQLLQIVKIFDQVYGKKQFKKDKIAEMGYLIDEFAEFSQKETDKTLYFDDTKELMRYLIKEYPGPKTSKYDRLNYEVEFLGYIQTVLPKMSKDYYYVTAMKGKDSRMVTIYQLKTGKSLTYKVRKKLFDTNPFEVGQILHITEFTNDFKWRKTVDEKGKTHWEQSSEREMLITKYAVLTKDKE